MGANVADRDCRAKPATEPARIKFATALLPVRGTPFERIGYECPADLKDDAALAPSFNAFLKSAVVMATVVVTSQTPPPAAAAIRAAVTAVSLGASNTISQS